MAKENVEIGALGWTHPGWDSSYYPEDLPEDWRLDYYSHHFQFVLMQANEWLHCSEDEIEQWLEDVKDSFDFFLALGADDIGAPAIRQVVRIKGILAERLQGLVVMHCNETIETSVLQELSALTTVYIDTDSGDEEAAAGTSPCWREGRSMRGCALGFIGEDAARDMRNMRAIMEAFIEQGGAQQLYLVYVGKPPSTKAMQDAQIILQMLA